MNALKLYVEKYIITYICITISITTTLHNRIVNNTDKNIKRDNQKHNRKKTRETGRTHGPNNVEKKIFLPRQEADIFPFAQPRVGWGKYNECDLLRLYFQGVSKIGS